MESCFQDGACSVSSFILYLPTFPLILKNLRHVATQSSTSNSHLKALSLLSPPGKFFPPISDQQSCPNVIPLEMLSWPTVLKNSNPCITYLVKNNIYTLSQTNYMICLQLTAVYLLIFQFLRGEKYVLKSAIVIWYFYFSLQHSILA